MEKSKKHVQEAKKYANKADNLKKIYIIDLNWQKFRLRIIYDLIRNKNYSSKSEFDYLVKEKNNTLIKILNLMNKV